MTFLELLRRRVRLDGARPLITCYDSGDARTELSATTYANWVAKATNLILWELDAGPGDRIALPVAVDHPGHWMTLVWVGACWSSGVEVVLAPDGQEAAVVSGPELAFGDTTAPRLACSLHPLGLGFDAALPDDVTDWADVVKSEGDDLPSSGPTADDLAWQGLSLGEVVAVTPVAERLLLDVRAPRDPLDVARTALVAPLLGGGSAVVVLAGDPAAVATTEHAVVVPV